MYEEGCECEKRLGLEDDYAVAMSKIIEARARQEYHELGPQLDALRLVAKARQEQATQCEEDRPSVKTLREFFRKRLRSLRRSLRLS